MSDETKILSDFTDALEKFSDNTDAQAAFIITASLIWNDYNKPIEERCKILQQMLDDLNVGKDKK
jgi:hypothetical protein